MSRDIYVFFLFFPKYPSAHAAFSKLQWSSAILRNNRDFPPLDLSILQTHLSRAVNFTAVLIEILDRDML